MKKALVLILFACCMCFIVTCFIVLNHQSWRDEVWLNHKTVLLTDKEYSALYPAISEAYLRFLQGEASEIYAPHFVFITSEQWQKSKIETTFSSHSTKSQRFVIEGTVSKIKSGDNDAVYILLTSQDKAHPLSLKLAKSQRDKLSTVEKGAPIRLVCRLSAVNLGEFVLCHSPEWVAHREAEKTFDQLAQYFTARTKLTPLMQASLIQVKKASLLSNGFAPCHFNDLICLETILQETQSSAAQVEEKLSKPLQRFINDLTRYFAE